MLVIRLRDKNPAIRLCQVTEASSPALRKLAQLYFHDFSAFDGEDVNEHGEFDIPWLDDYLAKPGCAYLIMVDDRLAGFALVDEDVLQRHAQQAVSEFFILRKFRRQGVGATAARQLLATRNGAWEAAVIQLNAGASDFWASVGRSSVGYDCRQVQWANDDWHGPVFSFVPTGQNEAA